MFSFLALLWPNLDILVIAFTHMFHWDNPCLHADNKRQIDWSLSKLLPITAQASSKKITRAETRIFSISVIRDLITGMDLARSEAKSSSHRTECHHMLGNFNTESLVVSLIISWYVPVLTNFTFSVRWTHQLSCTVMGCKQTLVCSDNPKATVSMSKTSGVQPGTFKGAFICWINHRDSSFHSRFSMRFKGH